jgi:hypothetical protein
MIDRAHDLPVSKQAGVLRISRGSVYYRPRPVPVNAGSIFPACAEVKFPSWRVR